MGVVEPFQDRGGDDGAIGVGGLCRGDGHGLAKALLWSLGIEVGDVVPNDAREMPRWGEWPTFFRKR